MRSLQPKTRQQDNDADTSEMLASDESSESSSDSASDAIWRSKSLKSVLLGRFHDGASNFGLSDLNEMNSMALLSAWHTIALWLSACVLMCEVLQKLLKGYVMWMEITLHNGLDAEVHLKVYLATLLRCWFVVLFYSDLSRFCFWLIRDAWRPDAFEAYRRAVCGLGEVEMRSGSLFFDESGMPRGWPEGLTRFQRNLNIFWQIFIYFSLDVYPILAAFLDAEFWGKSITALSMCSAITSHAGTCGLIHMAIFKFAWTCTDLRLKYRGFKEALRKGREADDEEGDSMSEDDFSSKEVASASTAADLPLAGRRQVRRKSADAAFLAGEAITEEASQIQKQRLEVATSLNICVPLCKWLRVVLPHVTYLTIIVVGIFFRRMSIVVFGLAFALYHLGAGAMYVLMAHGSLPTADKFLPSLAGGRQRRRIAWALQAWGDECCGLDYDTQLERRVIFTVMVALQTALFAFLRWHFYTFVCACLVLLQLMQLTVHSQVPWVWLVSGVEAAVYFVCTSLLALFCLPKKKMALETILLVLAHQIGLVRKTYYGVYGYKVVRLVFTLLFGVLFIVLAVTMLAVDSQMAVGDDFSMLCKNCTYYEVPFVKQQYATGLACPAWFQLGNRRQKMSLSDFGLLSAIAYESEESIGNALALFFPGWRLIHSKRVQPNARDTHDWTTFFEVRSPRNHTSVFLVRGTSTALDALNDMIIWMPAAVMQGFNFLGPDMLAPVTRAIGYLSQIFGRLDNHNYAELQRYVIETMKEEPDREYYITGHSLGGGLAKIVSLKAMMEGLELPAVTFMSPGLLATQYLVEGRVWNGDTDSEMTAAYLRDHELALTVMPENDIVSRIDSQTGQVVPIGCASGSPLSCHLMGMGLCEIFKECGSSRKDEAINIPCGLCPRVPCVDGVYQKEFPTRFEREEWEQGATPLPPGAMST